MPEFWLVWLVGWVASLLVVYAVGYYHGSREQGDFDEL